MIVLIVIMDHALAILIIAATHYVGGIATFGSSFLAVPLLLLVYGPEQLGRVVMVMMAVGLLQAYLICLRTRRDAVPGVLLAMLVGAAVGMPIGMFGAQQLATHWVLPAIGGLILAAGLMNLKHTAPASETHNAPLTGVVSVFAGVVHGAFASGGAVLVAYAQRALPDKQSFRATLAAFWSCANTAFLIAALFRGSFGRTELGLSVAAGALVLPVTWLADRTAQRTGPASIPHRRLRAADVQRRGASDPRRSPMMLRPALQTITWGDPQHEAFDAIFATAKAAGYTGLEIGFRRLSQVTTDEAQALLDKHGLKLSASHIGGNLADTSQASKERDAFVRALDTVVALGVDYLMYSGLNEPDDAALDTQIHGLNEAAKRCADRGVRLLYHNHAWEFADGRRIMDRLLGMADEALGFGPDVGWASKAGADVTAFLDELGDRVRVVHLKDFAETERDALSTVHFGEGVMEFEPVWLWLADNQGRDLWVTAEQDSAPDAVAAAVHNGAFLIEHLNRIGA